MHVAKQGQKLSTTCISYDSIHKESISHCSSDRACADEAGDPLRAATHTVSAPGWFQAHYAAAGCWDPDAATPITTCIRQRGVHSRRLPCRQVLRSFDDVGPGMYDDNDLALTQRTLKWPWLWRFSG